ncbi:Zn(II)2Cys6 transcription factor [Aspergillus alliaceus]|uniref:Zn(II)2Cys6 transcription factor n=1 Tax=Petromyces alliaceus TaxID=209559 RepID=UPI0012A5B7B2|nr:fungal-specific transcription factor domain-containing protein [Aspergillus alliaceus]KAB8239071.1 fungal-specific transcription factor domain-containing protein [Aspergillus alliaceus]
MAPGAHKESSPPAARCRQRTGRACEECRRRKLKCDGQEPRCGVCAASGAICEVNTDRALRGPKKGYLKALRNRVAMLESRLSVQQQVGCTSESQLSTPLTDLPDGSSASRALQLHSPSILSASENVTVGLLHTRPTGWRVGSLGISSKESHGLVSISELVQAELDQLYFDRVQPSIPLLHQRRYLSWARHPAMKRSCRSLQYAMWSLAALLSIKFQHFQESLYQEAKAMLELSYLAGNKNPVVDTEEIQAWILIATYEFMRTYHRLAWMSAGRACRLVQLERLHEIDNPANTPVPDSKHIEVEEKRRVFWMAYFYDHLFSMRNNWPVTLNEHVVCTRLPAPEVNFQNGQPVVGAFLSEAIVDLDSQGTTPFNECVILATICGRSLFHVQQYNVRLAYGDMAPSWSEQHRWLENVLTNRLQTLSRSYPSPTQSCDSMLLFAHAMAQATALYLCKGGDSFLSAADDEMFIMEYRRRALGAAQQIVSLTKTLTEFNFLKIHPLMPIPLLSCAEYIYSNRGSNEAFDKHLQELVHAFHQLKNVNNPSQNYMHLLELSCISTSKELAKESSSTS